MGNCISKINKDCLLALEEFMKNKTSFEKGKARPGLDMLTGGTCTRTHSLKGLPKKITWGMVERPFLKKWVDIKNVRCDWNGRCPHLGTHPYHWPRSQYYQWTKPASNKKRMTDCIKEAHTTIFTGQTGCGKTHLVLDLIEKEYKKHFDYIIIICPTLRVNKTYNARDWIKNDDKFWFKQPKDKLYQWI